MKVSLLAFTEKGFTLAKQLARDLDGEAARCGAPDSLQMWTADRFLSGHALIFVGAVGIAVRAIAPHIQSKTKDPAVVVVDECAHFAIPILSGHLGGANALARRIAMLCGAVPVLTTATDLNGVFAVDAWAKQQGCYVQNPEKIKHVSGKLLRGDSIALYSPWPIEGEPPQGVALADDAPMCDVRLSVQRGSEDALCLVPRIAVLGIGCRKNVDQQRIEEAFTMLLERHAICEQAIDKVCSIALKEKEPGILAFCHAHGFAYETFSAEQLQMVVGSFTASAFVQSVTGVDNVCERSAVLGSRGALYCKKNVSNGVTMAIALQPFVPDWRWQGE